MARSIRTNNKDHWELYSSIAEGPIETFETKEALIAYIAEQNVLAGKLKAIEEMMSFPSGWHVNGVYTSIAEKNEKYREWQENFLSFESDYQRHKYVDLTYNDLIKKFKTW